MMVDSLTDEWINLLNSYTPEMPIEEVRELSAKMWAIFVQVDAEDPGRLIGILSEMVRKPRKRSIA